MELFKSTNELISTLDRDRRLIKDLFAKRKSHIRYDDALALVDDNEQRLHYLLERGVIRQEADSVELEEEYTVFFEKVLAVNDEISVGLVQEYLSQLKHNIECFLAAQTHKDKQDYHQLVSRSLTKISSAIDRNVIDLQRNIDTTFKVEADYKVKLVKLKHLDRKREDISLLILRCERLFNEDQETFFTRYADESLRSLVNYVRVQINDAYHHLIDLQKQIIAYLHQIENRSQVYEKVRKLKYLRDQYLLTAHSDVQEILNKHHPVWIEPQIQYRVKLSIELIQSSEEVLPIVKRIALKREQKSTLKRVQAGAISDHYLNVHVEELNPLSVDELYASFSVAGFHLFEFICQYKPLAEADFDEKLNVFCQVASLYLDRLQFTGEYAHFQNVEYPIIYSQ